MASSLLFKITTLFSGAGFKAAGDGLGNLLRLTTPLIIALARVGTRLGLIQAVALTVFGRGLIRGIRASIDEAGNAEAAFTRLSTQLDLLGQGSRRNIRQVVDFSRQAASATRFAARETQEAVAIALRRTGNVEQALKQVSVAQDIASATGRGLTRTTLLLNIAQAGNARILRQITNLTRDQIRSAIRQGTLLDVLAKKFGGAAAREAGTLAGRISVLRNEQQLLAKSLGDIGLPLARLRTNFFILGTRGIRVVVDGLKTAGSAFAEFAGRFTFGGQVIDQARQQLGRLGQVFQENFGGISGTFQNLKANIQDAVGSLGPSAQEISDQLKLSLLVANRAPEDVRRITRDFGIAQRALVQITELGANSLRDNQLRALNEFTTLSSRIESSQAEFLARGRRQRDELQRSIAAGRPDASPLGGLEARIRNTGIVIGALADGNTTLAEASATARRELESLDTSVDLIGAGNAQQAENLRNRALGLIETSESIAEISERLQALGTVSERIAPPLLEAIEAIVKPIFQPNITLNLSPEQIRSAMQSGVQAGLAGVIGQIRRLAEESSRRAAANTGVI